MKRFLPGEEYKPHAVRNFIFSLITIFILLAALPVGVYFIGHKTKFGEGSVLSASVAPSANQSTQGETGYSFDLKSDSKSGSIIGVNVLVKSEVHGANLFATKISFPGDLLEVDSIATSSASPSADKDLISSKWVSANFDNSSGTIQLITGIPNPGLQTDPAKKYVLATIYFKPKIEAQAKIAFDLNSKILQDKNILPSKKTDVLLKVPNPGKESSDSAQIACVPYPACFDDPTPCDLPDPAGGWCRVAAEVPKKSIEPSIQLLDPIGGQSLDINTDQTIRWTQSNLSSVSIAILMNDQVLGKIASVSASLGEWHWKPKDYIYPTFANIDNNFKIQLSGIGAKGEIVTDQSKGPIAILTSGVTQQGETSQYDGDLNSDGKVDILDLSVLFGAFGINPTNQKPDLNGDRVVNGIDLWLYENQFGSMIKI